MYIGSYSHKRYVTLNARYHEYLTQFENRNHRYKNSNNMFNDWNVIDRYLLWRARGNISKKSTAKNSSMQILD